MTKKTADRLRNIFGVMFIIVLAFILSSMFWLPWVVNYEIDSSEYEAIYEEAEKYPELIPYIRNYMSDGEITAREKYKIWDKIDQFLDTTTKGKVFMEKIDKLECK